MGLVLVYLIAATWQHHSRAVRLFWLEFCDAACTWRRRSRAEASRSPIAASWSCGKLVFFHIRLHRSVPDYLRSALLSGRLLNAGAESP